jgi:hypothetical protein
MVTPVEATGAQASGAVVLTGVCLAAALTAAPLAFRSPQAGMATGVARVVGRVAFYALALALSLPWFAAEARFVAPPPLAFWLAATPPFLVAAAGVLVGLRRHDVDSLARGEAMLIAATALAFAAGLSLPGGQGATIVATLSLLFLGAGRVVRGSSAHDRAAFLEGLVVVVLAVVAKVATSSFEPLLRNGLAAACVAAATVAVVAFERRSG